MISMGREMTARISGIFCCRCDIDLTLVGDTAGVAGVTGFTVDELREIYQNDLMDLLVPMYRDKLRIKLTGQLDKDGEVEEVLPLVCKDNSVKWLMCRGLRVTDATGQKYLTGVLVDVTRSK